MENENQEKQSYNIDREDEAIKKTYAGEKKKLSQMSFGEKVEYIFAYYKIHIIIAVAAIALVSYLIYHQCTYVDYKLYGIVVNSNVVNDNVEEEITSYLNMDKHEAASMIAGLTGDVEDSMDMYNQINLYSVTGSIDYAFTDEVGANYICSIGALVDVEKTLPKELLELWQDRVTEFSVYNPDTENEFFDAPVAIDISGTKVQKYFGLSDDTCYLMICDLSGNEEYMQGFLNMLYEIESGEYMVKGK